MWLCLQPPATVMGFGLSKLTQGLFARGSEMAAPLVLALRSTLLPPCQDSCFPKGQVRMLTFGMLASVRPCSH